MKKTILVLAGLMVVGTGALFADGSTVNVSKTKVNSNVNKSTLIGSKVGVAVKADKSRVSVYKTKVNSRVNKSTLRNSSVGVDIDAK